MLILAHSRGDLHFLILRDHNGGRDSDHRHGEHDCEEPGAQVDDGVRLDDQGGLLGHGQGGLKDHQGGRDSDHRHDQDVESADKVHDGEGHEHGDHDEGGNRQQGHDEDCDDGPEE